MKKIRFFRYAGSKFHILEKLYSFIPFDREIIIIEPFVGSGGFSLNFFINYKQLLIKNIINDFDKNIIKIYKSFKDLTFEEYFLLLEEVEICFGDLKNNKESYYKFRNWFNKNFYNTNDKYEGFYLWILANTTINSLLRFGPNGMNSSYGNRFYKLTKENFCKIKEWLNFCVIENLDIFTLLKNYKKFFKSNINNILFFLDPPYINNEIMYNSNFNSSNLNNLLEKMFKNKFNFIYTDTLNEVNKKFLNKFEITYKIKETKTSISPSLSGDKKKINYNEYIFSNLPYLKNNFLEL